MFPIAILAGGLATRLRPLTDDIPKALVDINGEPFITHQLRLLHRAGVDKAVLCVGYQGEQIVKVVGDGSALGLKVDYVFDGPQLLGTGGAIRNAVDKCGDSFFVLYGDSYLDCDYGAIQKAFEASGKLGLMTVYHNRGQWDTSNVEYIFGRILAYDKRQRSPRMQFIDYGLGVFHRAAFAGVPAGPVFDLEAVYRDLLKKDQLAGFEVMQRFYEIGSLTGIRELTAHLAKQDKLAFIQEYLDQTQHILEQLDQATIEKIVDILSATRARGGRLFLLGVGGSAANASHAVNDFRKLAALEAYAPTDNVSELTARTNDEGWASVFEGWLSASRLQARDAVFVLSVGGGDVEKNVSPNLVAALQYARKAGASIVGVVGRDGGFTAQVADACLIIPTVNAANVTAHTEAFQGVILHLLVSHPRLKSAPTKWESVR